jgi:hypothetical protein
MRGARARWGTATGTWHRQATRRGAGSGALTGPDYRRDLPIPTTHPLATNIGLASRLGRLRSGRSTSFPAQHEAWSRRRLSARPSRPGSHGSVLEGGWSCRRPSPVQRQKVLDRFHDHVVDAATALHCQDLQFGQKLRPDPERGSHLAVIRLGFRRGGGFDGRRRRGLLLSQGGGQRCFGLCHVPIPSRRCATGRGFPLQPFPEARSRPPSGR